MNLQVKPSKYWCNCCENKVATAFNFNGTVVSLCKQCINTLYKTLKELNQ